MTGAPLVRLGIRVRRERAEIALAALLPILRNGAEETEPDQDEVEYALYAPRGELPRLDDIRALAGDALIDVTLTDVPPGWERRWHQYLEPVEVAAAGRRVRIRPPWHSADFVGTQPTSSALSRLRRHSADFVGKHRQAQASTGKHRQPAAGDADLLEIVIDPGELFGAGTHPTTQLCLELLLELDAEGPLCDWGAGSGILAITAARLGFSPVEAVEVMPDGLEAIARNAAANGVSVRTRWLNLAATPAPWAPTVTANLTVDLLAAIAAGALERPPERMIASGVLAERAGEVAEAFARHGMREEGRRVQGEWAAVLLTRPASTGVRP
jgi:ribosomal protein L11 methyltransferase